MVPKNNWQRVSPVAILYFFLRAIPKLIELWPLLIGVLAAGQTARFYALVYGVPALAITMFLAAVLQYLFFRFRIETDRLQLQTGVFYRKRLTLDFERVQQADIIKPFYFRPLGLATLGLESAGSQQQEVNIPGIPFATAEQLRARILEQARAGAEAMPAQPQQARETYQLHLPPAEVARYGLMHNTLLFLAPLAAPFGQYLGPAMEQWIAWLQSLPLVRNWEATLAVDRVWVFLLVGLVFIVLAVLLLFMVSTVLALIYYWDYSLARTGDRFQARFGFGTQRTRSFRLRKLQKVTIVQGVVSRLLRRHTLAISKAGSFKQASSLGKQRFVVPVVTRQNLAELEVELSIPPVTWTRVHPFYILDTTVVLGSILFLCMGIPLMFSPMGIESALCIALASYPAVALLAWRRWSQMGYYLGQGWLAYRQGFIGHKCQWLPTGKLQKLALSEPPLPRWFGLAHLLVWNTDGPIVLGYLPRGVAVALRNQLLSQVVSYKKAWF